MILDVQITIMKYLLVAVLTLLSINPAKSQENDVAGTYYIATEFGFISGANYVFEEDGSFTYSYTGGDCFSFKSYLVKGNWQQVGNVITLKSQPYQPIKWQTEIIQKNSKTDISSFKMTDENGEVVSGTYQVRLYHIENSKDFTVLCTNKNGVLEFDSKKYAITNPLNIYWSFGKNIMIPYKQNIPQENTLTINLPSYMISNETVIDYWQSPVVMKIGDNNTLHEEKSEVYLKKREDKNQ
ncbi:MAG: hypothetical protein ACJAWV_004065 [Flammeovirgaceae bacterium]|jgi:hypothetical protein